MSWKIYTASGGEKIQPVSVINPMARFTLPANLSIPVSVWTKLTGVTVDYDTDNLTQVANQFTVKTAGHYHILAEHATDASGAGGSCAVRIKVNGNVVNVTNVGPSGLPTTAHVDWVGFLNPGDVVTIELYQPSAGAANALPVFTFATIYLIDGAVVNYVGIPGSLIGQVIDYVSRNSDLSVNNIITEAAALTFLLGNSVAYDGITQVKIEAYHPGAATGGGTGWTNYYLVILRDSTVIGRAVFPMQSPGGGDTAGGKIEAFDTPPSGNHTYTVKAYANGGTNPVLTIRAGAGGPTTYLPAFLRVTRAA